MLRPKNILYADSITSLWHHFLPTPYLAKSECVRCLRGVWCRTKKSTGVLDTCSWLCSSRPQPETSRCKHLSDLQTTYEFKSSGKKEKKKRGWAIPVHFKCLDPITLLHSALEFSLCFFLFEKNKINQYWWKYKNSLPLISWKWQSYSLNLFTSI